MMRFELTSLVTTSVKPPSTELPCSSNILPRIELDVYKRQEHNPYKNLNQLISQTSLFVSLNNFLINCLFFKRYVTPECTVIAVIDNIIA